MLILCVAVFNLLLATISTAACPEGAQKLGSSCAYVRDPSSYEEATTLCEVLGGNLPDEIQLNQFLQNLTGNTENNQFWIQQSSSSRWSIECYYYDVNKGKMQNVSCTSNHSLLCIAEQESDEAVNYPYSPPSDHYKNLDAATCNPNAPSSYYTVKRKKRDVSDSTPTCILDKPCSSSWKIMTALAVQDANNFDYVKGFIDTITDACSADNVVTTFNAADKTMNTKQCSFQKRTKGIFASLYTWIQNSIDSEDVYEMFMAALRCDSISYLPKNTAGVFYFFTDMDCNALCTGNLLVAQQTFVSEFVKRGYVTKLVHVNGTDCLKQLFADCNNHQSYQCETSTLDISHPDTAINQLTTCDSNSFPEWAIIALVIVSALSVLGLVGIIFLQVRLRRKSGSNKFWKGKAKEAAEAAKAGAEFVADEWEIEPPQLEIWESKILGSGAFATVYEALFIGERPVDKIHPQNLMGNTSTSIRVAVKRLPPYGDAEARREFLREVEFMKGLGYHPHILSLIGCATNVELPCIILELCEAGDLLSFVRKNKNNYSKDDGSIASASYTLRQKDLISIAWQVADGLSYLHAKDIIHRDVAARNVLLTKSLSAKIADFGLCRLAESSVYLTSGGRLPLKWMPPEAIAYNEFSLKSDVWAFGIMLFEMFSLGDAPFPGIQPHELAEFLQAGHRPPQTPLCPNQVFKLMKSCWYTDKDDRVDISYLRTELSLLLDASSVYYGYISLPRSEAALEFDTCPITPADIPQPSKEDPYCPPQLHTSISGVLSDIQDDDLLRRRHEDSGTLSGRLDQPVTDEMLPAVRNLGEIEKLEKVATVAAQSSRIEDIEHLAIPRKSPSDAGSPVEEVSSKRSFDLSSAVAYQAAIDQLLLHAQTSHDNEENEEIPHPLVLPNDINSSEGAGEAPGEIRNRLTPAKLSPIPSPTIKLSNPAPEAEEEEIYHDYLEILETDEVHKFEDDDEEDRLPTLPEEYEDPYLEPVAPNLVNARKRASACSATIHRLTSPSVNSSWDTVVGVDGQKEKDRKPIRKWSTFLQKALSMDFLSVPQKKSRSTTAVSNDV